MRQFILVFLFSIVLISAIAQVQIVNPSQTSESLKTEPMRTVTDNGLEGVAVSYHFYEVNNVAIKHKNQEYSRLSIMGFSHLQEPGLPALPSHIDLIAVPEGATYQLKLHEDLPIVYKTNSIYPALQPARDTEGAPEPSFEIDEEFYATDQIFPQQSVQIVGTMTFRGLRLLMVQITPVQYNPSSNSLFVHQNIQYEIVFSGANRFADYAQYTANYMNQMLHYPLNAASIETESKAYYQQSKGQKLNTSNGKNYIIITHSDYLAAADSLANWKRQLGFTVEVVSGNNWTVASVKNEVHTRYANWTPKPDYLLIIGDHGDVPAEIRYTPSLNDPFGTDLYYVCMNGSGDYVPDMAKGRISAATPASAMMQVQKIINYERNPINDTSFYANVLNCAMYQDDDFDGYADRRFTHTSEDIRNLLLSKGYASQRIYYANSNVFPVNYNNGYYSNGQAIPSVLLKSNGFLWNGNASQINASINAGKFMVFHRDHGYSGGTGWAHPEFLSNNTLQLTNANKLPVVFSINCHTGEFTLNQCFAESFMRNANGGAVGVVAASYYSYSGQNDGFSLGMVDGIWSNPGLIPQFGSGGIQSPTLTAHSDIVRMGEVVNHGLVRMVQTWSSGNTSNQYTHELFHYFGDPSMPIFTAAPTAITASFSDTIHCVDTSFAISNCSDSNAVATIMGNGSLLGRTVLVGGNGVIHLNGIMGNFLTLTISGRNRIPLIQTIAIGVGNSLSLFHAANSNQCFGDSNGSLEAFPACGNPPYQFLWSTGDTVSKIENLVSGSYSLTITDAINSSITDTFLVAGPSQALHIADTIHDVSCYFESSGSVKIMVTGGQAPYAYQWSSGSSSNQIINMAAGNYHVTVSDSFGCVINKSFTVNQPSPLDMNTTFSDDTLNNCTGTASSIPLGGNPPYAFLWNDPAQQTTATATNLCKGLFKVTLTDSNQCISYRTIYVNNTVGLIEMEEKSSIQITPNPSHDGNFILHFIDHALAFDHLRLYNAIGQSLFEKPINTLSTAQLSIDLSPYAKGVYYLQLQQVNGTIHAFKLIYQ
jgi:hypothetical protein